MQHQSTAWDHEKKYPDWTAELGDEGEEEGDDEGDHDEGDELEEIDIPDMVDTSSDDNDSEDEGEELEEEWEEEIDPDEVLARQILDLVSTKQMTQKGCDLVLKMFKQRWESSNMESAEHLPSSFYMVKKIADARSQLLDDPDDNSRLVDLCPYDHCAYDGDLAQETKCPNPKCQAPRCFFFSFCVINI